MANISNEKKFEIIKNCIEDIKDYKENPDLSINQKQHIDRALETYNNLYNDAVRGKIDLDFLHENISSFLYYLQ